MLNVSAKGKLFLYAIKVADLIGILATNCIDYDTIVISCVKRFELIVRKLNHRKFGEGLINSNLYNDLIGIRDE